MLCKHCETVTTSGSKFCPECGQKISQQNKYSESIIRQVNPLLKPVDAANLLQISRWMLDELRIQRKLPADCYVVLSGKRKKTIRYRAKELLTWAGAQQGPITTAG
jgi:hypothetical protein